MAFREQARNAAAPSTSKKPSSRLSPSNVATRSASVSSCSAERLTSSVKFLKDHRDLAKKAADANAELTQWIQAHPEEAQKTLIAELKAETRSDFAPGAVAHAWKRIKFTTEVSRDLVTKAVQDGKDAGFLKGATDTSKLVETP